MIFCSVIELFWRWKIGWRLKLFRFTHFTLGRWQFPVLKGVSLNILTRTRQYCTCKLSSHEKSHANCKPLRHSLSMSREFIRINYYKVRRKLNILNTRILKFISYCLLSSLSFWCRPNINSWPCNTCLLRSLIKYLDINNAQGFI